MSGQSVRLRDIDPALETILNGERPATIPGATKARPSTAYVPMRDGVRLATDVHLPDAQPAPVLVVRTPYGRADDALTFVIETYLASGYAIVAQDCRGTGKSEPDTWDYALHEVEDGPDLIDWIMRQGWCNGSLFSFGGSYAGMTQWCMAAHRAMTAIAPEVCGLRVTRSTARLHMLVNGYARAVGKGSARSAIPIAEIERAIEAETMSTGFFNEPMPTPIPAKLRERYPELADLSNKAAKEALWAIFCGLTAKDRASFVKQALCISEYTYNDHWALPYVFDALTPHGINTIPSISAEALCETVQAPALVISGWYDWNLADTLASWELLQSKGHSAVAQRSRLIVTPCAHAKPGYLDEMAQHPALRLTHRNNPTLLLRWSEAIRNKAEESWPKVVYYLMGANEWRVAREWPIPGARVAKFYLQESAGLSEVPPSPDLLPDTYVYDPLDPTPTTGGSILSFLHPCGSVDVGEVQRRADILTYTTPPLDEDVDVVGPLRLMLYVSSSAIDTDFVGRLSDVFPDGRALHLQNGILRARYRNLSGEPQPLIPDLVYLLEIDMWATANRFRAGHRIRLDISSADFPRFDRNANTGGAPGSPVRAVQTLYRDASRPSHLLLPILPSDRGRL